MATTIEIAGTGDKSVELSDVVFGCDYNEPLVHQVVTAFLAGARAGSKAQKNRSEVRGGGAKPWRQKGQVEQEQALPVDPFGGGVGHLRPNQGPTRKKLIKKCTEALSDNFLRTAALGTPFVSGRFCYIDP